MSKSYDEEGEAEVAVVQGEDFVKGLISTVRRVIRQELANQTGGTDGTGLTNIVRAEIRKAVSPVAMLLKGHMDTMDAFQDHMDDRLDREELSHAELSKSVAGLLSSSDLVKGVSDNASAFAQSSPSELTPALRGGSPIAKGMVPGTAMRDATQGGPSIDMRELSELITKGEALQEEFSKAVPGMGDVIFAQANGRKITKDMLDDLRIGVERMKA